MQQRIVLLDRDGVINHDSEDYILSPDAWHPVAGSMEAIADLTRAGFAVFVLTNQSALNRGYFDLPVLQAIHSKMMQHIAQHGGRLTDIFFCPHRPDEACLCRKPATGMIQQLQARYPQYAMHQAFFVGDTDKDILLAKAINARPVLVRTGKGSVTESQRADYLTNVLVFDDLRQAVDAYILPFFAANHHSNAE